MKIDLLKLASGKPALLWIPPLIPSPRRLWMAGVLAHLSVLGSIHGVLLSACINGVVTRNSHQAAGFLHAWVTASTVILQVCFRPGLWMSVECGQIHSRGLVCVSFLSLLLLAQGQAEPSKVSVQGGVSILWASLMKEARDREAISRGCGQVLLRARLAHRLHLSWRA